MAFAGRHPMLSLALAGLTVAIIYTEIMRLLRGYKALKPAELPLVANQPGGPGRQAAGRGEAVAGGGGVPHRHGLGRRRAQAEEGRFRAGVLARRRHRRLAGRRPAAGQGPLSPPAGPRPAATGARAIIPRYRSRPAPPAHHQRFWSPKCPTKPPT